MKELTLEQKAQRYNEAFEEAKMLYKDANADQRYVLEGMFPELKESKDEKIRRVIRGWIYTQPNSFFDNGISKEEMLAWLEKQGEQKPAKNIVETWKDMRLEVYQQASGNRHEPNYSDDTTKMFSLNDIDEIIEKMSEQNPANKVESKFKVGDWVVCEVTSLVYQIKNCIENLSNHKYGYDLTNGGYIGSDEVNHYHLWTIQDAKDGDVLIHNSITFIFKGIENGIVKGICTELSNTILNFGEPEYDNDYCPATKEQHDILMKVMTDAGYTFDFEKKELKEIEQNPAWNEEDEKHLTNIIMELKKQYDRPINAPYRDIIVSDIDWLKSLKDRVQPKQEWSKEEQQTIKDAVCFVLSCVNTARSKKEEERLEELADKLQDLRPQSTWKPSEEQIKALEWQVANTSEESWQGKATKELLEQLKNLSLNIKV